MEQLSAVRSVLGDIWVAASNDADDYWSEGVPGEVQIERTDNDEVRIGFHLGGETHESAGVYLSRSEAIRLMLGVAQAVGDR